MTWKNRLWLTTIALVTTIAIVSAYFYTLLAAQRVVIPPEVQAIEFTSSRDAPITLADFHGGYTLMAFGYTHCPDVCPLTLADFRRIKLQLPESQQDNVRFAFISVDGARDTPAVLDEYVTRFHPDFVGITTQDDTKLDQLAAAFDVFYERRAIEGSAVGYVCDHTAAYFLLNPEGDIVRRYPFLTVPDDIAVELSRYLLLS